MERTFHGFHDTFTECVKSVDEKLYLTVVCGNKDLSSTSTDLKSLQSVEGFCLVLTLERDLMWIVSSGPCVVSELTLCQSGFGLCQKFLSLSSLVKDLVIIRDLLKLYLGSTTNYFICGHICDKRTLRPRSCNRWLFISFPVSLFSVSTCYGRHPELPFCGKLNGLWRSVSSETKTVVVLG